ncbi:class I SAM-dependent methyltransferase [Rossellomorea marisflavi]|uniref:class I SAM-dependent methyltransferase n=1 Tax=Rossellomorea marisflavi TaxID=189381 RepID=UPI00203F4DE7|nr:class I SAM-dependent methyltransferase [Rossellomorea marisflavi]MCM2603923.1 class I SAM-dependent methyltransferase [Rossellomorea marisflavi]
MNSWEQAYRKTDNLWGKRPDRSLIEYSSLLNEGDAILDLGMGEGRNAYYFAAKGHPVTGVDYSSAAVKRCGEIAIESGVEMEALVADITRFPVPPSTYSLIILSNVLNFFHPLEIERILHKAISGLVKKGMIYIQAFSREDPAYARNEKMAAKVDEGTFYREKNDTYIHFFSKSSLLDYFTDFDVLIMTESYRLDLTHGEPHYHGVIELLVRKKAG